MRAKRFFISLICCDIFRYAFLRYAISMSFTFDIDAFLSLRLRRPYGCLLITLVMLLLIYAITRSFDDATI